MGTAGLESGSLDTEYRWRCDGESGGMPMKYLKGIIGGVTTVAYKFTHLLCISVDIFLRFLFLFRKVGQAHQCEEILVSFWKNLATALMSDDTHYALCDPTHTSRLSSSHATRSATSVWP